MSDKISPIGTSWKEYKETRMTPDERAELELKANIICELIEARNTKGISQKELETISGVKQPIIARMEKGTTDPQLTTILRVLRPLGKTLAIVPIDQNKNRSKLPTKI